MLCALNRKSDQIAAEMGKVTEILGIDGRTLEKM